MYLSKSRARVPGASPGCEIGHSNGSRKMTILTLDRVVAATIGVMVSCMASWGQVGEMDPCIRREIERGRTEALNSLSMIVGPIGDLNGDGLADIAAIDPNFVNTPIVVRSRANGKVLLTFAPDKQDRVFITFFDAGDVDRDGVPDIAVGTLPSVHSVTGRARLAIHSGMTGGLICAVVPGPVAAAAALVVLPQDVDASGSVTIEDLAAVVEAVGDPTVASLAKHDIDKDDIVTAADMYAVFVALGTDPNVAMDMSVVWQTLSAAPAMTEDGAWVEFADASGAVVVAGIGRVIKCFLCGLSCGDALDNAWKCREWFWDQYCACYDIADQLDQTECLERVRRDGIRGCLDPIIDATVECADCIRKCSPTAPLPTR